MEDYLKRILAGFKSYNPTQDTALIEKAYKFAENAHKGQKMSAKGTHRGKRRTAVPAQKCGIGGRQHDSPEHACL